MDNGFVEIKIEGSKENSPLTPDNYDIGELIVMLQNAESLFYHGDKKNRPVISYEIREGSVEHIFKMSIKYVIAFNMLIGQISQAQNIDFLEPKMAEAFENLQKVAAKKNYTFSIKTSLDKTKEMKIDKTTKFYKKEDVWTDAEFYFYGKIIDAGGKENANIHVSTEAGELIIDTPISFLEKYDENLLYKTFGIRAKGKQSLKTGEIDTSKLEFIELVNYSPKYDEQYLNELIEKASESWAHIADKDAWLREIRGYDA